MKMNSKTKKIILAIAVIALCLFLFLPLLLDSKDKRPESNLSSKLQGLTASILFAENAELPIPLAKSLVEDIDTTMAYQVQKSIVQRRLNQGKIISGYKIEYVGVDRISAAIYADYLIDTNEVDINKIALMVEPDIAIKVNSDIRGPLKNKEELMNLVEGVYAAVELPQSNMKLSASSKMTKEDLIVAGGGSCGLIIGDKLSLEEAYKDIDNIKLFMNNKEYLSKNKNTIKADMWESGLWLVNNLIENGYKIKTGEYLLLRFSEIRVPANPGIYEINYWNETKIKFSVLE